MRSFRSKYNFNSEHPEYPEEKLAEHMVVARSGHYHLKRRKTDLVVKTIKKMIRQYEIPEGVIFHSDWGSQYTSEEVMYP